MTAMFRRVYYLAEMCILIRYVNDIDNIARMVGQLCHTVISL